MFIIHGSWTRKYMKWIMAVLLLILIPGFILLFTQANKPTGSTSSSAPTLRGKPVNPSDLEQARQTLLIDYLVRSGGELPKQERFDEILTREALKQILILEQADQLGIVITDDDIRRENERQPAFQNEQRQFDYYRYTALIGRAGVTAQAYENALRRQLAVTRVRAIVAAGAKITPLQVQHAFGPLQEKITLEYVQFAVPTDTQLIGITDDEVRAVYDRSRDNLRNPRQVNVRAAFFATSTNGLTVTDKQMTDFFEANPSRYTNTIETVRDSIRAELLASFAQARAGDEATKLTLKLNYEPGEARPDFAALATSAGAILGETGFFGPTDTPATIKAGPAFSRVAFTLNAANPFSDPIQGDAGYYVLEFLAEKPAAPMTFDQAKPEIVRQLQRQHAYDATLRDADRSLSQLRALMANGKTFTEAAAELKLTAKTSAPFSLRDENADLPAAAILKEASLSMKTGVVSDLIKTADGALFFMVRSRQAPTPEEFAKEKEALEQDQLQRHREALWQAWLNKLWRDAKADAGATRARKPAAPAPAS